MATVMAMVADGMTAVEILADLQEMEAEALGQALRYAAAAVRAGGDPPRTRTLLSSGAPCSSPIGSCGWAVRTISA